MATREDVLDALAAIIQGMTFSLPVNGRTTWAGPLKRRVQNYNDVPSNQQPAVYLYELDEQDEQRHVGTGAIRILHPRMLCYVSTQDQTTVGGTALNIIIEALETALKPDNQISGTLTLAGGAYYCRIDGRILKIPGDLDGQALMVVPINIMVP